MTRRHLGSVALAMTLHGCGGEAARRAATEPATVAEARRGPPVPTAAGDRVGGDAGTSARVSFVRIPMRDGVELAATLYGPLSSGAKLPVILAVTPYGADRMHSWCLYYAEHGYAAVAVDIRGRGDSGGELDVFHPHRMDMTDIVTWLAAQPWSNGSVAMMGGSYLGMTQWWALRESPAPLKTIVPIAPILPGVDFGMRNGIRNSYDLQWLVFIHGRTVHPNLSGDNAFWRGRVADFFATGAPFHTLDAFVGMESPEFQEQLRHATYDEFWKGARPTEAEYRAIAQPILTITGQLDDDQRGALTYYRDHTRSGSAAAAEHYLVIGPWDHAGTREPQRRVGGLELGEASLLDVRALAKGWYDWRLRGAPRPPFLRDRVAYYVSGPHAEEWRYSPSLDAPTVRHVRWFLASRDGHPRDLEHPGSLSAVPSRDGRTIAADEYSYDPTDSRDTQRLRAWQHDDDWAITTDGLQGLHDQVLIYESAPGAEELEIVGAPRLSLWLVMDVPDTDIFATLYEVGPRGDSRLLAQDAMRARFRTTLERESLVPVGVPVRVELSSFRWIAHRAAKGSRLRLVVGAPNASGTFWLTCGATPCVPERNFNAGGAVADESMKDGRVAHVKVLHDESHSSHLDLPLGE